jgi:cell division protein FtsL
MNNVTEMVHKVRQAPWRVQRQWLGLFLLALVCAAMVAGLYLNITSRAALAGREIQLLENEIADNQRVNSDLETQLAELTSTEVMAERALAMGFRPVRPEDVTYVIVPGYQPPAPVDLSSSADRPAPSILLPEYTQSLFDWFTDRLVVSTRVAGSQP